MTTISHNQWLTACFCYPAVLEVRGLTRVTLENFFLTEAARDEQVPGLSQVLEATHEPWSPSVLNISSGPACLSQAPATLADNCHFTLRVALPRLTQPSPNNPLLSQDDCVMHTCKVPLPCKGPHTLGIRPWSLWGVHHSTYWRAVCPPRTEGLQYQQSLFPPPQQKGLLKIISICLVS